MIFKRKNKWLLMIGLLLSCITIFNASAAGAGQPGSDADPLVTKSYVDQQIALLSSQIGSSGSSGTGTVNSETISQLQTDVGDLTKFVINSLQRIEALENQLKNSFISIEVKAGQKILLSEGSEALLRSGSATAIKGDYGVIVDVTTGKDLNHGDAVPLQHLLLSSRSDGRGLHIKTKGWIVIRGDYSIQQ
jgi:hypothetical protein